MFTLLCIWLVCEGGRRIDTAISYHDQTGIGQAIQKSPLRREEVFITSKVGPGYPLGYQDTLSQMKVKTGHMGLREKLRTECFPYVLQHLVDVQFMTA